MLLVYRDWKARPVLPQHDHRRSQSSPVSVNGGDSVAPASIQMEEARPSMASQRLAFCSICQDFSPVEQSTILPPCGHTFCQECVKQHICAQLQENRFPINCPDCVADPATQETSSERLVFLIRLDITTFVPLVAPEISYVQAETMLTDAQKEKWWELEIAPFAVKVRCPG